MKCVNIKHVPLYDLKLDENNPNKMNKRQRGMLKASLMQYGFVQPLVIDGDNVCINGNQKLELCQTDDDLKAKHPKVPCVIMSELTEQERLMLQQALNKIHGEHDRGKDAEIFDKLIGDGAGDTLSKLLGTKEDSLVKRIEKEKQFQIGAPTPQKRESRCKPGDTWQLGPHMLYCGDYQDDHGLTKEKIHLLFADPPYGIDVVDGKGDNKGVVGSSKGGHATRSNRYKPVKGDDAPFNPESILALKLPTILWGGNVYHDKLPAGGQWFAWVKKPVDNFRDMDTSDVELAWSNIKGKGVRGYYHLWYGMIKGGKPIKRDHPNQKPVEMLTEIIIDRTKPGEVIYDPFLGSGSTLLAAHASGRICLGCEIDLEYCDVIVSRFESSAGLKAQRISGAKD